MITPRILHKCVYKCTMLMYTELGSRDGIGVAMVVRCGISVVAEKTGREARLAGGGIAPIAPNGR